MTNGSNDTKIVVSAILSKVTPLYNLLTKNIDKQTENTINEREE